MNRRNFLSLLAASLTLDPERLLWRPGAKLISIPKPLEVECCTPFFDLITMETLTALRRERIYDNFMTEGIFDHFSASQQGVASRRRRKS